MFPYIMQKTLHISSAMNILPRTPPALVHMTDESPWKDISIYCTEQYKQEKDGQSHIWYYHRLRRLAFPHALNFQYAPEDVIHQTRHHAAYNGSGYYISRVMHAEIHSAVRMKDSPQEHKHCCPPVLEHECYECGERERIGCMA